MSVGTPEILVILIVALLVFGPQRLPEVGRQVGAAVRELRRMQDAVKGELDMVLHPEHGTSPRDAPPVEPGDHTYSDDYPAGGYEAAEDGVVDVESVDVTSVEWTPEPNGSAPSTNGAAPAPDRADDEGRFHGPPDSFI
jgi:sec-independent protein translocase protein TatB